MDDLTERFAGLIADHGEKAVIAAMASYCIAKSDTAEDTGEFSHSKVWDKLAYRLRGALDGMKRGEFGRVR